LPCVMVKTMANHNRMTRLLDKFHNLKFKWKLLLSYVLIGVIPFIVFSTYLYIKTSNNIMEHAKYTFNSDFNIYAETLIKRVERIENAMKLISMNETVVRVATETYINEYTKYEDVTRFDELINTLVLMNPELKSYQIYFVNNLVGTQLNFLSIDRLKDTDMYKRIEGSMECDWFFENGNLYVALKIYNPYMMDRFSVLLMTVDSNRIFEDLALIDCAVFLREELIHGAVQEKASENNMEREKKVFSGQGSFVMRMNTNSVIESSRGSIEVFLMIIGASFIVLIAAINGFSRAFVRRIHRINKYLSKVVEVNFNTHIPERYQDEIGILVNYVNNMIKETRHKILDVYNSKLKQREYEIQALQAQINPHFLYNTLSAINWYAIRGGNESISKIVMSLSKFYRTALNSGNSVTTIRNETENIQAYIDIQLMIHNHSFDVNYEIDEAVMEYSIPNLIVQPVVENAIEHGIDHKEDGRGKLTIKVLEQGECVVFEIMDNGPGMIEDEIQYLLTNKSKSYGLRNVNKRLKLFFGDEYQMTVKCEHGTIFHIRIPKQAMLEDHQSN